MNDTLMKTRHCPYIHHDFVRRHLQDFLEHLSLNLLINILAGTGLRLKWHSSKMVGLLLFDHFSYGIIIKDLSIMCNHGHDLHAKTTSCVQYCLR